MTTEQSEKPGNPWALTAILSLVALVFAVWQAMGAPGTGFLSPTTGAVAVINDQVISQEALDQALKAVASDRRDGLDTATRKRVLDTLIAEELLLQQAINLGLARHDQGAKKALIDGLMQSVMNRADQPPADGELEDWYRQNGAMLTEPARLSLIAFKAGHRLDDVSAILTRSGDVTSAMMLDGIPHPVTTHGKYLPEKGLINILPPSLVRAILPLEKGDIAGPMGPDNWFVWIIDRKGGHIPPLDQIREQAEFEWLRQRQQQAVADYIEELRAAANIDIRSADQQ